MRVLVDTSAWVDFLNGHPSAAAEALAELLEGEEEVFTCGIVVAEVFQGLRRDREREAIQRSFRDLLFLEPSGMEVYLDAARLYRSLRKRGVTVRSTVDCIIATLAAEADCALLARDKDMEAILDSGLLRVERWPNP